MEEQSGFFMRSFKPHPLTRMPHEIWSAIFEYLQPKDHANMLATCRFFYQLLNHALLQKLYQQEKMIDYQVASPVARIQGCLLSSSGNVYAYRKRIASTSHGVSLHASHTLTRHTQLNVIPLKISDCKSIAFSQYHAWGFIVTDVGEVYLMDCSQSKPRYIKVPHLRGCGIVEISLSEMHALALTNTGKVLVSGDYHSIGQLTSFGSVSHAIEVLTDFQPIEGKPKIKAIATGAHHSVLLSEAGKVFTTARYNEYGQAGRDQPYSLQDFAHFRAVTLTTAITQIACGDYHTLLLAKNGAVYGAGHGRAMGLEDKKIYRFKKITAMKAKYIYAGLSMAIIQSREGQCYYAGIMDNLVHLSKLRYLPLQAFPGGHRPVVLNLDVYNNSFLDEYGRLYQYDNSSRFGRYRQIKTLADQRVDDILSRIPIECKQPVMDLHGLICELFNCLSIVTPRRGKSIISPDLKALLSHGVNLSLVNKVQAIEDWIVEAKREKDGHLLRALVGMINQNAALLSHINLCLWRTRTSRFKHDITFNRYFYRTVNTNPLTLDENKKINFYSSYLEKFIQSLKERLPNTVAARL